MGQYLSLLRLSLSLTVGERILSILNSVVPPLVTLLKSWRARTESPKTAADPSQFVQCLIEVYDTHYSSVTDKITRDWNFICEGE